MKEKTLSSLIYYACLFRLNLMRRNEEFQSLLTILDLLINEGLYHEVFLDLMCDSDDKTIDELGECYQRVLEVMNISVPTKFEDMRDVVIQHRLTKIIDEGASPIDEIGALYSDFVSDHEHESFPPPLCELFWCYYAEVWSLSEHEHKTKDELKKIEQRLFDLAKRCIRR